MGGVADGEESVDGFDGGILAEVGEGQGGGEAVEAAAWDEGDGLGEGGLGELVDEAQVIEWLAADVDVVDGVADTRGGDGEAPGEKRADGVDADGNAGGGGAGEGREERVEGLGLRDVGLDDVDGGRQRGEFGTDGSFTAANKDDLIISLENQFQ